MKYNNSDMIVIDRYGENEEDRMLAGFMSSHLDNEMDSFNDSLINLMQSTLICTRLFCILLNDSYPW